MAVYVTLSGKKNMTIKSLIYFVGASSCLTDVDMSGQIPNVNGMSLDNKTCCNFVTFTNKRYLAKVSAKDVEKVQERYSSALMFKVNK